MAGSGGLRYPSLHLKLRRLKPGEGAVLPDGPLWVLVKPPRILCAGPDPDRDGDARSLCTTSSTISLNSIFARIGIDRGTPVKPGLCGRGSCRLFDEEPVAV